MIYLFNSASKPNYFENVYRLMGMPSGSRREMRYTVGKNSASPKSDKKNQGQPCTVCYIDRFSGSAYTLYPIRRGVIRRVHRTQTRVYYDVELGDHCHSISPSDFTKQFYLDVDDGPALVPGDPECDEDGMYCVSGPDYFDLVKSDEGSWSKAVDQISSTSCFSGDIPAFFVVDVRSGNKSVKGDRYGLKLKANKHYDVTVVYRAGSAGPTGARKKICIDLGEGSYIEERVGSKEDKIQLNLNLSPIGANNAFISVTSCADEVGSNGGETSYGASILYKARAAILNVTLLAVLFGAILAKEVFLSTSDSDNTKILISSVLEFLPFGIIVWAMYSFRGYLKLPTP